MNETEHAQTKGMKLIRPLWFAIQFILFCAILLAPLIQRTDFPNWLRALGLVILIGGIIIAVLGYRTLGSSHSPWTTPVKGGSLVTTGIYDRMRHPIYSGWILATLGLEILFGSLLGIGVAIALFIFYDLKSREEDKWLDVTYPDYEAYKNRVKRFAPGLY